MATLTATQRGKDVLVRVDDADFEDLSAFSWYIRPNGYAARGTNRDGVILMHRHILGLRKRDGLEVDHFNRDKLDNRRENLRLVSRSENSRNRGSDRNSTSVFLGVSWDKSRSKWTASACEAGRRLNLGRFRNELDAALVALTWRHDHTPTALYPRY